MTNRVPMRAIAYAIAAERDQWWPNNSTPEARAHIKEALDRLSHALAIQVSPPARAEFLQRAGVTS